MAKTDKEIGADEKLRAAGSGRMEIALIVSPERSSVSGHTALHCTGFAGLKKTTVIRNFVTQPSKIRRKYLKNAEPKS